MPYIPEDRRRKLESGFLPENAGELNYMFSDIIVRYLHHKGLRYQQINDIVGALEGAKLELYRRVAGPYEDKAIDKNGDIGYENL